MAEAMDRQEWLTRLEEIKLSLLEANRADRFDDKLAKLNKEQLELLDELLSIASED